MTNRVRSLVVPIALVALSLGRASAQERSPVPPPPSTDWRIEFGVSSGSSHENVVRHTVADHGQIAYVNRRGAAPAVAMIPPETVREITSLVDRLRLSEAQRIPSNRFNACIVSQHLPNVWFSLRRGASTYSLTHCNTVGQERPRDEYTLMLTADQSATYRALRSRLESLFGAGLRSKVGTLSQTIGDALSGAPCEVVPRDVESVATGKARTRRPAECRSDHACGLVSPREIRSVTGRNDVAVYAPEKRQSATTSDCYHQDLVVSIRLANSGWTTERLDAQREQAVRAGYRVQRFGAGGATGYTVAHAPMVATTSPYTGETAFLLVGEKLLAISVQTFPTDYLEVPDSADRRRSTRGSVIPLAIAAAARLEPR